MKVGESARAAGIEPPAFRLKIFTGRGAASEIVMEMHIERRVALLNRGEGGFPSQYSWLLLFEKLLEMHFCVVNVGRLLSPVLDTFATAAWLQVSLRLLQGGRA